MGGGGGNTRELDQTPTWAVASVCGVIVIISILLEKGLHHVGEFFSHRKKKAMVEALEKVKAELMVLGFISLLLVFGQNYIIKICISEAAANTMLPCKLKATTGKDHGPAEGEHEPAAAAEHLAYYNGFINRHGGRFLAEANMKTKCPDGKVSLISINGLHQLHIFIFFLAVFHVTYSAITMALGRAKVLFLSFSYIYIYRGHNKNNNILAIIQTKRNQIRGWKEWEKEAAGQDYEFSNGMVQHHIYHSKYSVHRKMMMMIIISVIDPSPCDFIPSVLFKIYKRTNDADPTRFRFTHETSFVRQHMNVLNKTPASFYIVITLSSYLI
jgi:mlo protein